MSEIIGIGTDLCAISRIERSMERQHFYERVFSPNERAYLETKEKARAQSAAAMFATRGTSATLRGYFEIYMRAARHCLNSFAKNKFKGLSHQEFDKTTAYRIFMRRI